MKEGTVKIIEDFFMPQLNRKRTIRIYLPPDYEEYGERYPVLYMHDGQNLFDAATSAFGTAWEIGLVMDKLYNEEDFKGLIIVGVDNGCEMRYEEYSPWRNEDVKKLLWRLKDSPLVGGQGFEYIDFLVNTLRPYIDSNFRTLSDRKNTAISGSSMGGFISLCAGLKYQDVFSKIAAFYSAIWFSEEDLINFIENTGKHRDMKIYMDSGTRETSNSEISEFSNIYLNGNKRTYETLKKAGFKDDEVKFVIDEGAIHNEIEWRRRFPEMIRWMFLS